ncbi:kinase-like domain-containing protein [Rhizophagus diaphanus]|nr:kinase-like domain-containing protein [Rhizophagus diaphanus] [Rhizophagus sp. MUCL 43196]
MKFLKEWICEIGEEINDNIDYFVYNEFKNLEEIYEETVNGTFKKVDLENQRITVVIKNLNNPKINENDFKEFITKLKVFHKINHPNIIRFLGLTRVLEYANEGNLRDYSKSKFNMLKWNDNIQMAQDITCGLMFLHSEQIIHGNLHADTILIKNGRLMITDFGLSVEATSLVSENIENIVYVEPRHLHDPSYKLDMRSDIYSLGVLLWELSSGRPSFLNYGQGEFSLIRTLIINEKREDPIESTPLEYQNLYQKCWHNSPDIRPKINEVHEILSQLNLQFKIFNDLLTKQQIIKKFKLNYRLILTENNATPSMKEIFEDGELNINLYEEQPIVYVDINMKADACINFPIAEITYNGDLLETFDNNDECFGHFFARKILVSGKLFIKDFNLATPEQINILKFYVFCAYNSSKYSTEIQFNKLFGLNLLPKIVTLGGEELNTHEKLIEWMNNLYQYNMIDIISYSLIPISQLSLKKLLLIDELESFNEKQPGVINFKEKLSLKKWIGNTMYDNLVNWADNLHLFKGLIINEDYKIRISKKIAVNLIKFPEVNLISDRTYPKMIMPSTNLEVILISNNIFSIKDLSTFPFIKNNVKHYEDYIHIIFKHEQYKILFNKDHIKPTKEFEQLIESALNSLKPLKALQDIFNEYGHLFPQRIILGKSLKNISPTTTSEIDLEHLTFDDLNVPYLLT